MEQEFSWSGLLISMSIAFFIVILSALMLHFAYENMEKHQYLFNSYPASRYKLPSIKTKTFRIRLDGAQSSLAAGLRSIAVLEASAAELKPEAEVSQYTQFLTLKQGEQQEIKIKIKNIGPTIWKKGEVALETGPSIRAFSRVKHDTWQAYYKPGALKSDISTGKYAEFSFKVQAPTDVNGTIQENFQLVRGGYPVAGSLTRIFIDVVGNPNAQTANKTVQENSNGSTVASGDTASTPQPISSASISKQSPDFCIALTQDEKRQYSECNTDSKEADTSDGIIHKKIVHDKEPIIRVGLFDAIAAQRIISATYYDVISGSETAFSGVAPSNYAIVGFDSKSKKYGITIGNITRYVSNPVRLVPRTANAVMTLKDYRVTAGKNSDQIDNRFRNIIEFNYSAKTGKLWVINELPVSYYLKGIAETTDNAPQEFQKALLAAAHTYAMYHYNRGKENGIALGSTKHAEENYHVDATNDQVYRGYGSEARNPILVKSVDAIRGVVITYDDNVVVTPYFSRSDGRTRSWSEVWYGSDKPWLVSVPVPQDKGQTLWGHGVGMSARGALIMARDEGKKWQEIVGYFYKGTELQKIYN